MSTFTIFVQYVCIHVSRNVIVHLFCAATCISFISFRQCDTAEMTAAVCCFSCNASFQRPEQWPGWSMLGAAKSKLPHQLMIQRRGNGHMNWGVTINRGTIFRYVKIMLAILHLFIWQDRSSVERDGSLRKSSYQSKTKSSPTNNKLNSKLSKMRNERGKSTEMAKMQKQLDMDANSKNGGKAGAHAEAHTRDWLTLPRKYMNSIR